MPCVHLKKLYQVCEENEIKLASPDLIHIVCEKCGHKEVCPSVLIDEYEAGEEARERPEKTGRK